MLAKGVVGLVTDSSTLFFNHLFLVEKSASR